MIDTRTGKNLLVRNEGTAGPYLWLPYSQVDEVREFLDTRKVPYSVNENVISFDGGPEMATIDFGRKADAAAIQALLGQVEG